MGKITSSLTLAVFFALAGCSDDSVIEPQAIENQAPTAAISADDSGYEGSSVFVNGEQSADEDGSIASYQWSQLDGTQATFTSTDSASTTIILPMVSADEELIFQLQVTDDDSASSTVSFTITVLNDATNPDISTISVAEGSYGIGASATITITAANSESGLQLQSGSSFNDQELTGFAEVADTAGTYTATYTVVSGNSDWPASTTVDTGTSITLVDVAGNASATITEVDLGANTSIDANAPTAKAGNNKIVNEATGVALDAGESFDAYANSIASYSWEQFDYIDDHEVSLTFTSNTNDSQATFTTPEDVAADTTLTFLLTVADSVGNRDTDTIEILVNNAPTANAGIDQQVNEGAAVTLDGTNSSDTDGDTIARYNWVQVADSSGTALSVDTTSVFSSSPITESIATFTAPDDLTADTTLYFQLTVTDGDGASHSDIVAITISNNPEVTLADSNPAEVNEGATVTLSGSADDSDGIDGYVWEQIDGDGDVISSAEVTLDDGTATATFTAPDDINEDTILYFRLTATDDKGGTGSAIAEVLVNSSPTLGLDENTKEFNEGVTAELNANAEDSDGGTIASYSWIEVKLAGDGETVETVDKLASVIGDSYDQNITTISFTTPTVDQDTTLTFQLTVTDNDQASTTDSIIVTINNAPTAEAGDGKTVNERSEVTLSGSDSSDTDTDSGSSVEGYSWQQVEANLGGSEGDVVAVGETEAVELTIDGDDPSTATFSAPEVVVDDDNEGVVTLTFQLTITDNDGATHSDLVEVAVHNLPVVESVHLIDGAYGIDDTATVYIRAGNNETGLILKQEDNTDHGSFNGGLLASFTEIGDGLYSATYTVSDTHDSVANGGEVPTNITLVDQTENNHESEPTTAVTLEGEYIDTVRPAVDFITIANGTYGIGDEMTLYIQVEGNEAGLTIKDGSDFSFNNVSLYAMDEDAATPIFEDIGNGTYQTIYTVGSGGDDEKDRANGAEVPIAITLTDPAGNDSTTQITTVTLDGESIDATAPSIAITSVGGDDNIVNSTEDESVVIVGTTDVAEGSTVNLTLTKADDASITATGTATVGSDGGFSTANSEEALDISGLADGTYTVTASVSDDAGNEGTATKEGVLKDTELPTISITSVGDDNIVNSTEDESVVIVGTTDVAEGSTVNLTLTKADDASITATGTATVGSDGGFSTANSEEALDISGLADGTYTVTASVSDDADNEGTATKEGVLKDTELPTISITSVGDDNIVNSTEDESVVIVGTTDVAEGSTVNLTLTKADDASITATGTATVGSDGGFSTANSEEALDISGLADGTYTVTASVSDDADNEGTATKEGVLKDTELPTISITSVGDDNIVNSTEDESVVIVGTTDVAEGSTVNLTLTKADDASITATGTATVGSDGGFSTANSEEALDISGLADGTYTVTASVSDDAGNEGTATKEGVLKDTELPTISITSVGDDNIVNSTEDESVVIVGTTDVAEGSTVNLTLTKADDASITATGTATVGSDGGFSTANSEEALDISGLADGTYTVTASVSDDADNEGTATKEGVLKDTELPTISITSVGDDNIVNSTEDESVVIVGTTDVAEGSTVNLTLTKADDASITATGTATVGSDGGFSTANSEEALDISGLADGTYTVTASVSDDAGNEGTATKEGVLKDTELPTISITSVGDDNIVNSTEDESVVIVGTTDVAEGSTVNLTLTKADDASITATGTATVGSDGGFSTANSEEALDISGLADGTYTVTASVSDDADNEGTATKEGVLKDTELPTISITSVGDDNIVNSTEDESVVIVGTTDVAEGSTVNLTLTKADDASITATGTATVGSDGGFSTANSEEALDISGLADGTYTVTASVSDDAGNEGTATKEGVLKDTELPTISITSVGDDNIVNSTEDESVVIVGTTDVAEGSTVNLTLTKADDASITATGTATVGSDGGFSTANSEEALDISGLADGTYTVTASVSDDAGNEGTATKEGVLKDTESPSIDSVSIAPTTNTTGIYKVDDPVEVTITASNSDTGLVFNTKTFSSNPDNSESIYNLGEVAEVENSPGTYTTTYTVEEGHDDVAAGGAVTIVLEYADAAGNAAAEVYTVNTNLPNGTSIDANSPTIEASSISVAAGTYGIGGEIAITINASESGLSLYGFGVDGDTANGTFNGQKIADFANLGTSNTYTGKYTVTDSDASVADGGEVEVNIALVDASGNIGTAVTKVMLNGTAIDAQAPAITSASIVDSGNYVVGDSIIIYVTSEASEGSAVQIKDSSTVGTNSYALTDRQQLANSSDVYTAVYVVQEYDVVDTENNPNTLTASIILTDSAGNDSEAWTTVDVPDNFTIDASSPTQTISDIALSADTGPTDGTGTDDFITKTASQEITATLSVALEYGDSLYGSVDSGASWIDVSNITDAVSDTAISWTTELKEGTYNIVFQVRDSSGNEGEATTQQYTLDTGEPTIALAAAEITANEASTANLDASTSSDNGGGTGIVSYAWKQVESGGGDLGDVSTALSISDVSSASTTASTPVLLNDDGSLDESTENVSFYFQLTIEDLAGNEASEILTLTVSNYTTPAITATAGTAPDFDQISLSWDADSSLTYSLYRSTQDNCYLTNYQSCASPALYTDGTGLNIADNSASVADSGLAFLTSYYYWLETKRDSTVIALSPAPGSGSATTATSATTSGPQLNDTGVIAGGDYSSGFDYNNGLTDESAVCNGGYFDNNDNFVGFTNEDCEVGRDADSNINSDADGHAGFSFTRLNFDGSEYSGTGADYTTQPWSCVIDNVTGLVWEIKTTNGGTSDASNQYTWYNGSTGTKSSQDTGDLIAQAKAENSANGLCGQTNWRLPTVQEIESLASYNSVPAIDKDYFPNTQGSDDGVDDDNKWYWTAELDYDSSNSNVWAYNAYAGSTASAGSGSTYYVRLVSSSDAVGAWFSDYSDSRYTDNEDGTISDHRTGLMWMKCTYGLSDTNCGTGTAASGDWEAAFAAADTSNAANSGSGTYGHTDWRLPNKKELSSIVDLSSTSSLTVNQTIFPSTQSADYWTSTPSSTGSADEAFTIDFATGTYRAATRSTTNTIYVRLVRDID